MLVSFTYYHIILNVGGVQERVAAKALLLLEEINKARPHVLLGYTFWHFLDLLAVANGRSRVVVLLLVNGLGIFVASCSDDPPVADNRAGIIVLLLANDLRINFGILLETREWEIAVVVHGGLGDGNVDVGGRHYYFVDTFGS